MKILAAGDLHGDKNLAKELAERAEKENVDLVILNGDLVEEGQAEGILGIFKEKGKKVLIIPGNHELPATTQFLSDLYGFTNLHAYSMYSGNVGIFGCGGANLGLSQLSEKEIFSALKYGFDRIKKLPKKIMVTHVHPADSVIEKFSKTAGIIPMDGSSGLKKAIDQFKPDILICGHVHEAEGIEEKIGNTTVINVGKKGKIIEL
ncbi:metallophosphoesterase [Candidatus Woesearchaeota archaeon]|nr:metallophosphoesterase [Candidatus Woesearchaeota archaeon]